MPPAVELDVWSDDLLERLRADGLSAKKLARVKPKRQLVLAAMVDSPSAATLDALRKVAAHTRVLKNAQMATLARNCTSEPFLSEACRRAALAPHPPAVEETVRWATLFLAYLDPLLESGRIHPLMMGNKPLARFVLGRLADRRTTGQCGGPGDTELFAHVKRLLAAAKALTKREYPPQRRYPPYLDIVGRFSGSFVVFEAHPVAMHFDTRGLAMTELCDLMLRVFRIAGDAGLTGLEMNQGGAFAEAVPYVAEQLGLRLSVGSDLHYNTLIRRRGTQFEREFGCPRQVPAVLFRFPGSRRSVPLTPLGMARDLGRLMGRPLPDRRASAPSGLTGLGGAV